MKKYYWKKIDDHNYKKIPGEPFDYEKSQKKIAKLELWSNIFLFLSIIFYIITVILAIITTIK